MTATVQPIEDSYGATHPFYLIPIADDFSFNSASRISFTEVSTPRVNKKFTGEATIT
jgi:hypothetical protein